MSMPGFNVGPPGIRAAYEAVHRRVMRGDPDHWLPGGAVLDGSKARDAGNTNDVDVLRAGLLLGKLTSGGKLAPSILGVTTGAYTSGGTTLAVSAATAVEIARRVGTSGTGTLYAIGPPSAAGTVAATAVTFSAVNTSTGDITVTSLGVNKIAGTFITAADGSENPLTFIWDGTGVKVTDFDGTSQDVQLGKVPVGGTVIAEALVNWPSDTSLQAWIRDKLRANGNFVLDYAFIP